MTQNTTWGWRGDISQLAYAPPAQQQHLLTFDHPLYAVRVDGRVGLTNNGTLSNDAAPGTTLITALPPLQPSGLGDAGFRQTYGVRLAYVAGAMANGIASEELVIAMGRDGMLASFGAAGLSPTRIEQAIHTIQAALPGMPYAFNLIHSPQDKVLEHHTVERYLKNRVPVVEASAFLGLTLPLVRYRVAGLSVANGNQLRVGHRLIAKVSRVEVAQQFLEPPPPQMVATLQDRGWITPEQAKLARYVPMADDITVEADSGGHTDNRPLAVLLPLILALRDRVQATQRYPVSVRVGAAGGLGTPSAIAAAFALGAAYVVTGSVNQCCVEAGTSDRTKALLAQATSTDVMMAPSADMFEMGVKVQLLKRGTMFPVRAQRLYHLYETYPALDALPADDRTWLEETLFQHSLDEVWQATARYFQERDPQQVAQAEQNPKHKMALVFRWYLGLSSRWATVGEPSRSLDYQIWCGPAMGAFNAWVAQSSLAQLANRRVVTIAHQLMRGAVYHQRSVRLQQQGVSLPASIQAYDPA